MEKTRTRTGALSSVISGILIAALLLCFGPMLGVGCAVPWRPEDYIETDLWAYRHLEGEERVALVSVINVSAAIDEKGFLFIPTEVEVYCSAIGRCLGAVCETKRILYRR